MAKRKTNGKYWTDKTKIEVVTTYLAVGSAPLTEAITGVSRDTIRHWKMTDWWKDIEREIRDAENIELSARLKKIVDKSIEVVSDRLEKGDHIFDSKTGQILRVPVKMKDALKASTDLIDKRQILMDKPTKITEQRTVEDRLNKLAEEFTRFSQAKTIQGEVISVESTVEALEGSTSD